LSWRPDETGARPRKRSSFSTDLEPTHWAVPRCRLCDNLDDSRPGGLKGHRGHVLRVALIGRSVSRRKREIPALSVEKTIFNSFLYCFFHAVYDSGAKLVLFAPESQPQTRLKIRVSQPRRLRANKSDALGAEAIVGWQRRRSNRWIQEFMIIRERTHWLGLTRFPNRWE
jgi:hypothetical protein